MTKRNDVREEFREQTGGYEEVSYGEFGNVFSDDYVEWLEDQLIDLRDAVGGFCDRLDGKDGDG